MHEHRNDIITLDFIDVANNTIVIEVLGGSTLTNLVLDKPIMFCPRY
jgi:hypothetical protein